MKTLRGAASPAKESAQGAADSIMMRQWSVTTPTAEDRSIQPLKRIGPGQPYMGANPADSTKPEDIAPAQESDTGKNPHLLKMGGDRKAAEDKPLPAGDFTELKQGGSAVVDQVIDPLRIRLKDKRIIQLAGIDVPDLNGYDSGEFSIAATAYLKTLLESKPVILYQTRSPKEGRINQMGYELAHVVLRDGEGWVQGALLTRGLVRIRPSARNPEMAAQMSRLEAEARSEKRGLWTRYKAFTPDTAVEGLNGWAVVEGTITKTGMARNTLYLNFGPDWRTDFTVSVPTAVRREMEKKGIDPLTLAGHTVRVHGWLESYNGPALELDHPAWLEITDNP